MFGAPSEVRQQIFCQRSNAAKSNQCPKLGKITVSAEVIWGKNMKRGRNRRKCKEKGRRGKEKGRKGKDKEKMERKRVK
jgi:hypothetical protein